MKTRNKTGIRASQSHQIWHADITIVGCLNGKKYYVYLLMDNYFRFILNYQVSTRVSARIRLDSIRNAVMIVQLGDTEKEKYFVSFCSIFL